MLLLLVRNQYRSITDDDGSVVDNVGEEDDVCNNASSTLDNSVGVSMRRLSSCSVNGNDGTGDFFLGVFVVVVVVDLFCGERISVEVDTIVVDSCGGGSDGGGDGDDDVKEEDRVDGMLNVTLFEYINIFLITPFVIQNCSQISSINLLIFRVEPALEEYQPFQCCCSVVLIGVIPITACMIFTCVLTSKL